MESLTIANFGPSGIFRITSGDETSIRNRLIWSSAQLNNDYTTDTVNNNITILNMYNNLNNGGLSDEVYDYKSSPNMSNGNIIDGFNNTQSTSQGLPVSSQIILIILYSLTTVLSVIGNLLVILVFTLGWRSRTDLRGFLINLAIADLIMAMFCMPFTFTMTMLNDWIFTAPMCPIVLYMQTVSVTVSVFTNMAIGIDRFWVVLYPLKSRITKSRSKFVIAFIWLVALVLSSVQLAIGRVVESPLDNGKVRRDCIEVWYDKGGETWRRVYTFFILLSTYLVPLTILTLTYGFVGWKLCKRTPPGNADEIRDMQQLKSKRRVIKMLVVVVLLFGICWLPLHVFILVLDFNPHLLDYQTAKQEQFFTALYYTVHWLAMSNSCVNPIVYGFLNDSFRHDLRRLLRMWFPCLTLCFACLRDPTLTRNQTMGRGFSYYDNSEGSFKNNINRSTQSSLRHSSQTVQTQQRSASVRLKGCGQCKTNIKSNSDNFLLEPPQQTTKCVISANTTNRSKCVYSKIVHSSDHSSDIKHSPNV